MNQDSVVRARIASGIKIEAAAVLGAMGLTLSDAFRMMLMRVAAEKALPFEPLRPNSTTIAAMHEVLADRGEGFETVEALFADLNADD